MALDMQFLLRIQQKGTYLDAFIEYFYILFFFEQIITSETNKSFTSATCGENSGSSRKCFEGGT